MSSSGDKNEECEREEHVDLFDLLKYKWSPSIQWNINQLTFSSGYSICL